MTVQTEDRIVEYVGDAASVNFAFNYVTLEVLHIKVFIDDTEILTGFTTTLNVDQGATPGGAVVFDAPPITGAEISINRTVPLTQEANYTPYNAFPAESHERALDIITMMVQQINPDTSDLSSVYLLLNGSNEMSGDLVINGNGSNNIGVEVKQNDIVYGHILVGTDDNLYIQKLSGAIVEAQISISPTTFGFTGGSIVTDSDITAFEHIRVQGSGLLRFDYFLNNFLRGRTAVSPDGAELNITKYNSSGVPTTNLSLDEISFSFTGGDTNFDGNISVDGDVDLVTNNSMLNLNSDGSQDNGIEIKKNGIVHSKISINANNELLIENFDAVGVLTSDLILGDAYITSDLAAFKTAKGLIVDGIGTINIVADVGSAPLIRLDKDADINFMDILFGLDGRLHLTHKDQAAETYAGLSIGGTTVEVTKAIITCDTAPTDIDHLTRKDYVDTVFANMQAQIDALQAQVNAL